MKTTTTTFEGIECRPYRLVYMHFVCVFYFVLLVLVAFAFFRVVGAVIFYLSENQNEIKIRGPIDTPRVGGGHALETPE